MSGNTDRLDRIEADADKSRGSSNAPYVRRKDVLALVEIARAARAYLHSEDADDAAIGELLDEIEPNRQEALLDAQKTTRRQADADFEALRVALSALDGSDT